MPTTVGSFGTLTDVDLILGDDDDLSLGVGVDALLRWSTADADNHAAVLGLGDSNQALHITDKAAIGTDWNVAADTDPTLYLHSNTTPATDYLRIGGHDGTTAVIDVVGGTTLALQVDGTSAATLTATALTLSDTVNIVLDTNTGTKIGTATGQKLGFYNAAPIAQPSAYTQTYATANKTVAAITLVGSLGGTADGSLETVGDTMGGDVSGAIMNNFQEFLAEVTDIKQAVNAIIDDLQALGLVG